MSKLISPSLSPNLEFKDVILSISSLISLFSYKGGEYVNKVEGWFRYNYDSQYAYTFSSAREAEYAILSSLGIKEGDEVAIQAFTCVAVIHPILWMGAKPLYIDIDPKNLSMDPLDLQKKISKKTKAIILQHTFGMPGNIEGINLIAKKNKLFLIEDCAHEIGVSYKNKKLGQFGDAAFFSFGRDKSISSVFGGIAITQKKKIAEKIQKIEDLSPYPSYMWIIQQLLHPLITYIIINLATINPKLSKFFHLLVKKIHLLSKPVLNTEATPYLENRKVKRFPNALARIASSQLVRLNKFNKRRIKIYNDYKSGLSGLPITLPAYEIAYLRIPIITKKNKELMEFFRQQNIYLGDWYSPVISPHDVVLDTIYYKKGLCPKAEDISRNIINLPCYPTMQDADSGKIIDLLTAYYGKNK